jgi:hypothetical protein
LWDALIILSVLLCGGDYDQDIKKCDGNLKTALQGAVFDTNFIKPCKTFKISGDKALDDFLVQWRIELQHESRLRGILR